MRPRTTLVALLAGTMLLVGAACGAGSEPSAESWVQDFCRASATWGDALSAAEARVAAAPRKEVVAEAAQAVRKATNTFVTGIQERGLPGVASAARISRELSGLAEGLDTNAAAIEQTVNDAVSSHETATSTFDVSVTSMSELFDATLARMRAGDEELASASTDARACRTLDRSPG